MVWNITGNPGMTDQVIALGSGTGDITGMLTGLNEVPVYYVRAFATNSVGTAFSPVVSSFKVCLPLTVIHTAGLNGAPVDKTVTYKTISTNVSGEARCWITQNLGSDQQAVSLNDATEASAGWYFQFNRSQGYKMEGTTRTPDNIAVPWVSSIDENSQWLAVNDPCSRMLGGGWRLPTSVEWTSAIAAPQNWRSAADMYTSVLKLHGAGYLTNNPATLTGRGTDARYWSSTGNSTTDGKMLYAGSMNTVYKYSGLPVRCLRNEMLQTLPSVSVVSLPLAEMTATTAKGSAVINPDGNAAVTARGFVWNTTGNPTLSDQVVLTVQVRVKWTD
ncbi:hypothetical protein [Pedobacter sp. NJ-S-72]